MILGLSVAAFTVLHTTISLVAILAGFVVLAALLGRRAASGWTGFFLAATVATSVTGFMFPLRTIGPPHVVGAISLVVLALALAALYGRGLRGAWRPVYVVSVILALYLNVFVGVVQAFQKIPALRGLAPTGTEAPFVAAQGAVLALFVGLGVLALRGPRAAAAV